MAERRQLPPQIRRVELDRRAGSKTVVRYQLTVDTGTAEGKRKQLRRRYRIEKEARAALAEIQGQVNAGTYVQPSTLTVEQTPQPTTNPPAHQKAPNGKRPKPKAGSDLFRCRETSHGRADRI
jgi:integrase